MDRVFRKGSIICIIKRNSKENLDVFLDRGNFIVSQKPANEKEYNEAVIYSNIYANYKYLHCTYDTDIQNKLNNMMAKCMVEI